ncbi:HbrB-domain-containing protein [Rhodofomes roseus]|uniref:HbrB-domain-containing protein n=1 Tax=Rhodofomes roseus TaxID=34475 RepID=A0ABQ8K1X7_9APHY|nr:HbrB-domain-containing protein [Rhodofomes roseus]KAH9830727.1 HbrB-domain-containing protein [Rhodofomes roseus]
MVGGPHQHRRCSQEGGVFARTPERRRSSSQGDETPRAVGFLLNAMSAAGHPDASLSAGHAGADPQPSKRLAFLSDKLLSSASVASSVGQRSAASPISARTHSRGDSASGTPRELTASPVPTMASATTHQKGHTSPTKASARTYDSKLVSREMHRLGNLAHSHLPTLAPSLAASQNASSHTLVSSSLPSISSTSSNDPWQALHVHVLPLFNGEPLRVPIEDLNQLVKRHLQAVVSQSPAKALAILEHDASELIASGMVTLNAKISDIDDEKLMVRVVELWGFFWDQVLPYVEGALLPLQTDPLLSSLYRVPKGHKPNTSPITGGNGKGSMSSIMLQSAPQIDVRTVALQSFRDAVILPVSHRMYSRLTLSKEDIVSESLLSSQPRLQQMLLVLVSQRPRPLSFSLTSAPPPPTAGEAAVQHLLRAIRAPLTQLERSMQRGSATYLSTAQPRDRRGWIAHKDDRKRSGTRRPMGTNAEGDEGEEDGGGDETPRMAARFAHLTHLRERDKEFLDSLRYG